MFTIKETLIWMIVPCVCVCACVRMCLYSLRVECSNSSTCVYACVCVRTCMFILPLYQTIRTHSYTNTCIHRRRAFAFTVSLRNHCCICGLVCVCICTVCIHVSVICAATTAAAAAWGTEKEEWDSKRSDLSTQDGFDCFRFVVWFFVVAAANAAAAAVVSSCTIIRTYMCKRREEFCFNRNMQRKPDVTTSMSGMEVGERIQ